MDFIEILGFAGSVFAAAAVGVLVYDHQTDVLRGPHIEGRTPSRDIAAMFDPARAMVEAAITRINWRARNAIYLASLA
jgi:hypothetical protein